MTTMRVLEASAFAIDALSVAERPIPAPRRGEILVRIRAASLNYRDLAILTESYLPQLPLPYVPASDCCGEIAAVGDDVKRFKVGDRVIPIYRRAGTTGCRHSSCGRSARSARRSPASSPITSSCRPRTRSPRRRT